MVWLDFIIARFEPVRLVARLKERRDTAGLVAPSRSGRSVRASPRGSSAPAISVIRPRWTRFSGRLPDPTRKGSAGEPPRGSRGSGNRPWTALPPLQGTATRMSAGRRSWLLATSAIPRAGPALRDRLADPDRFVRGRAVSALARLGAPCLPLVLDALADSDPRVRQGAAEVLGLLGDPVATDGLLRALRDPAESVRRAAAVALLRINPAE